MLLSYYDKNRIPPKRRGSLSLVNGHLISEKTRFGSPNSIDLPFFYKVKKVEGINAIVYSEDLKYTFDVKLSRKERIKLYLMFKGHWYYDNFYTRFVAKYSAVINIAIVLLVLIYRTIVLIKDWNK